MVQAPVLERPAVPAAPSGAAGDGTVVVAMPEGAPLTDELLERCVELNPHLDIERGARGELIISGGSAGFSPYIGIRLGRQFEGWSEFTGIGLVGGADNGLKSRRSLRTRAADVCWFDDEQAAEVLRQAGEPGYPQVMPTVVVEIRSTGQSLASQLEKVREWMRDGAKVGWMIDPTAKTVYVFRDDGEPEAHVAPSSLEVGPEMPGMTVEFERIWALLDQG